MLVRADAAYYSHAVVSAAPKAGADVSVTVRMNPSIRRAIESISADTWTTIEYPGSARDAETGRLISRAEVAEVPYTAFTSKKGSADQRAAGREACPRTRAQRVPGAADTV